MTKVSKEAADYIDSSRAQRCKTCSMFIIPDGCTKVAGSISPDGHCRFYDPVAKRLAIRHIRGK